MAINLSIVGIFYSNNSFNPGGGSPTVQDVMNGVRQNDRNFFYTMVTAPGGNIIVDSIGAFQPAPFKGRTGIMYPRGIYRLAQSFTSPIPNPYTVWQYYLFDQNGKRAPVPANLSFTKQTVQDGWSIVWRLVTICSGPLTVSPRLREMLPDEAQKELGMV